MSTSLYNGSNNKDHSFTVTPVHLMIKLILLVKGTSGQVFRSRECTDQDNSNDNEI